VRATPLNTIRWAKQQNGQTALLQQGVALPAGSTSFCTTAPQQKKGRQSRRPRKSQSTTPADDQARRRKASWPDRDAVTFAWVRTARSKNMPQIARHTRSAWTSVRVVKEPCRACFDAIVQRRKETAASRCTLNLVSTAISLDHTPCNGNTLRETYVVQRAA